MLPFWNMDTLIELIDMIRLARNLKHCSMKDIRILYQIRKRAN